MSGKAPTIKVSFSTFGTIADSSDPNLVGQRVDIEEAQIELTGDTAAMVEKILNSDAKKLSDLTRLAGLNPKTSFEFSDFSGTKFFDDGDFWEGSSFRGASLAGSKWRNTSIKGMLLEDANLTGAEGLSEDDLAGAYINAKTRLPAGINRAEVMAKHAALNVPAPSPFTGNDMIKINITAPREVLIVTDTRPQVPRLKS